MTDGVVGFDANAAFAAFKESTVRLEQVTRTLATTNERLDTTTGLIGKIATDLIDLRTGFARLLNRVDTYEVRQRLQELETERVRNTPVPVPPQRSVRKPTGRSKVVVVEDDPSLMQLYRELLEPRVDVAVVGTARAAREILDETPSAELELVILDLVLPDGFGVEILQYLRGLPDGKSVPVLIASRFLDASVQSGITSFDRGNPVAFCCSSDHRRLHAALACIGAADDNDSSAE